MGYPDVGAYELITLSKTDVGSGVAFVRRHVGP
jgi:hypothetical protein